MPRSRSFVTPGFLLSILVCLKIRESVGFVLAPSIGGSVASGRIPASKPTDATPSTGTNHQLLAADSEDNVSGDESDGDGDGDDEDSKAKPSTPEVDTVSTFRIDDGGSNLTDRFKYKVHALMGDYDPTEGTADDEDQDGNIMKAFVDFPTQHVFDVVGRVSDNENENEIGNSYAREVKRIVFVTTGDQDIECEVFPRGKKFVKVRCKATVASTTMINMIYDELGKMESTVMKF